jgi:hypothetical protein
MEKINSAGKIIRSFFSHKEGSPTFSEPPNTKNIDETDKEAQQSNIASLMLMLMGDVRYRSDPASENEDRNAFTLSSQKVIRIVAAEISTGIVIL